MAGGSSGCGNRIRAVPGSDQSACSDEKATALKLAGAEAHLASREESERQFAIASNSFLEVAGG
jgi:hypothetical protein